MDPKLHQEQLLLHHDNRISRMEGQVIVCVNETRRSLKLIGTSVDAQTVSLGQADYIGRVL